MWLVEELETELETFLKRAKIFEHEELQAQMKEERVQDTGE